MDPVLIDRVALDNSAWARLNHPALTDERLAEIAEALESGRVAVCLPFLLEAGYSARNANEHADLLSELGSLPSLTIDPDVEQRAVEAQRDLARTGHHRIPPVDILVAALADRHGFGILHYDHDYDNILARTHLSFESVWLAPRGSL